MARIRLPLPDEAVMNVTDVRKIVWTPIPDTEYPYLWKSAPCTKCGITSDSRSITWALLLFQYGPLEEQLMVIPES